MKQFSLGFFLLSLLIFSACKTLTPVPNEELTNKDNNDEINVDDNMDDMDMSKTTMLPNEMLMIDEINQVRRSPQEYILNVKEYMQSVRNNGLLPQSNKDAEIAAARELIFELSRMEPLEELIPHEGLYQVAINHGKDVQNQGMLTHQGSDGTYPWNRIAQQTDIEKGNENLIGGGRNIRETVLLLLVDSGVAGRGHRVNLLNPEWRYVAVYAIGRVNNLDNTWIQVFGGESSSSTSSDKSEGTMMTDNNDQSGEMDNNENKRKPFWKKDKENNNTADKNARVPAPDVTSQPRNTDANVSYDYMKSEEQAMIEEINLFRGNPRAYIKHVENYLREYKQAGWDAATTKDEIDSANELIRELQNTGPLTILLPNRKLHRVAVEHGEHMKQTGQITHSGADGTQPYQRIRKKAAMKDGNENLVGGGNTVRESVIMLLVDSGIPNRGHRKVLMDSNWQYVSCYKIGTVGGMPNTWVQNFGY